MARCLLATGFPFRAKEELQDYLRTFELMFLRCSGIRRAGAAALDLCWLPMALSTASGSTASRPGISPPER